MASTVITAFDEFQKDMVNLDTEKTKNANSSKDWLIYKIHKFPDDDTDFPKLYTDIDIQYGSFARHTKIRRLNDIDLMIGISAEGATYWESRDGISITVPETATKLLKLCNDNTKTLNSIKMINKFIKSLKDISQYAKSDIKRNKEAAVLELSSYEWNFDIVPCLFTKPETDGRTYYLIPDGNGNWKKTDPRLDKERVISINKRHDGNVLNVIRVLKYWNRRPTMPSAPSYLFENLMLNYFASSPDKASKFVDMNLPTLLSHINTYIMYPVNDPKNIQGDLNTLTYSEKQKISTRAYVDYQKALEARQFENDKKMKESINKWREIFGDNFPRYND
ncbi:MAG TPA: nucleotidyltransferase [Ignavibacteriales bacterium]|nr:nucleotidyltransferase [Ignavibacteriales bacterium]